MNSNCVGDAYRGGDAREVPSTLHEAAVALYKSKMLRDAFGGDVVDHDVHAARWDQYQYDRRVTDLEVDRGFDRS